jgi:hypothetical protein
MRKLRIDVSGGKARRVYALVARGARAAVRGAALGWQPPPCTIGIRPEFRVQFRKKGVSIRGVTQSLSQTALPRRILRFAVALFKLVTRGAVGAITVVAGRLA